MARNTTDPATLSELVRKIERLMEFEDFLGMMTHEIQNPLGSMTFNIRTLNETLELPEDKKKKFVNIQSAIRRIQNVIDQTMVLLRSQQPNRKKIDIHKIIESSLLQIQPDFAKIEVLKNYCGFPAFVLIDPNQISQAFVIFLSNAIDAMSEEGRLTVTSNTHGRLVSISIDDNGVGIPDAELETIFNPFFTTKPTGIGLGLSTASYLVVQNGGQIVVGSEVGVGTTVTIRFPTEIS